MRQFVDVLIGLAELALLAALGFRFLSPNLGFVLGQSFVTPLFFWQGAMGLLTFAGVFVPRQIRGAKQKLAVTR